MVAELGGRGDLKIDGQGKTEKDGHPPRILQQVQKQKSPNPLRIRAF